MVYKSIDHRKLLLICFCWFPFPLTFLTKLRAQEREKQIAILYSYQPLFSTNQHTRNHSVILKLIIDRSQNKPQHIRAVSVYMLCNSVELPVYIHLLFCSKYVYTYSVWQYRCNYFVSWKIRRFSPKERLLKIECKLFLSNVY